MQQFRTIRLAALGAALLVGSATVVAAQPPAPRAPRREAQRMPRALGGRDQLRRSLFRDIDLTLAQQRQIRDIGIRFGDQRQDLARSLREKAGVTRGQRPDSAARARLRTELQTQNRALMERQLGELRGVLTTQQRTAFDRNVTTFRQQTQARADRMRDGRTAGAGARGFRGQGLRGQPPRGRALRERAQLRDRMLRQRGFRDRDLRDRGFPGRDFRRYE